MTVHFIGAGPGAADLITVRGRDLLARCPVCLYAGSVVPPELLAHCPPGARLVDTAPLSLDEIEAEFVAAHAAGAGRGAAALGRPLDLERGRRAGAAAGGARHPLHADPGRAGLRRRGGGARARADHPRGGAEPGADPRLRPRLGDARGRDAGGLRRAPARRSRSTSPSTRCRGWWPSSRRSTAPTARWRWWRGRAGRRSGWCAATLGDDRGGARGRPDRPDGDDLRRARASPPRASATARSTTPATSGASAGGPGHDASATPSRGWRRTLPEFEPGHVWLAGAGPGGLGCLTLEVVAALAAGRRGGLRRAGRPGGAARRRRRRAALRRQAARPAVDRRRRRSTRCWSRLARGGRAGAAAEGRRPDALRPRRRGGAGAGARRACRSASCRASARPSGRWRARGSRRRSAASARR